MTIKYLLPLIAGFAIVLQSTLNRNFASQIGLASALFVNSVILIALAGGLWFLMRFQIIEGFSVLSAKPFSSFEWWHALPGILGFVIIFTTPLAIDYLGANITFAIIICTQLVVSMLWDSYVQKTLPSTQSIVGVLVMFVGLLILFGGKK